jgi:hypothetical protein
MDPHPALRRARRRHAGQRYFAEPIVRTPGRHLNTLIPYRLASEARFSVSPQAVLEDVSGEGRSHPANTSGVAPIRAEHVLRPV